MFFFDSYNEVEPPIVFDTAAGFTASNRILLAGQFGVEVDTSLFKIGNSVTAWNSLGYAAQLPLGYTAENSANKSTDGTFASNSDTLYPSQKAAKTYIDTAVLKRLKLIVRDYSDSSALTGTTAETKLGNSIIIPANSVVAGDIVAIRSMIRSASVSGSSTVRLYINTSDSFSGGAIQIGTLTTGAFSFPLTRHLIITAANSTKYQYEFESIINDYTATGGNQFSGNTRTSNIDWTVNQYLILTFAPSVNGASSVRTLFDAIKE